MIGLHKIIDVKNTLLQKMYEASFFWRLIVTFISGSALSLAQAPTNLWWLIFPCLGFFFITFIHAKKTSQAFWTGFVFAFGYFLFGLYWIGNALLVEGNSYQWAWPLAVVALPLGLSLFTAIYTALALMMSKGQSTLSFLSFCFFLTIAEWARGYTFTGFPWNLYGYVWSDFIEIAQITSVIGPYGLTFLTILWGTSFGYLILSKNQKEFMSTFALIAILFSGLYAFGHFRLNAETNYHEDIAVHLVQPNIAQADKWRSEKFVENFEKHISLSQNIVPQKRNLIIWSETALPPAFLHNPSVNERIQSILNENDILLAGGLDITRNSETGIPEYHNALIGWSRNQNSTRLYSKSHLVPFGEYIPFQQYIPIPTVTQFSGFERGVGNQTITFADAPRFSPLICYEIIFPHQTVDHKTERPDFLLTITNDGWYGRSAGPYQHFDIAKFRAIEQGLPVIRVANTGISGIIDAHGRVITHLNLMEEGFVNHPLPSQLNKITFYAKHGEIPFIITMIALLGFLLLYRKYNF